MSIYLCVFVNKLDRKADIVGPKFYKRYVYVIFSGSQSDADAFYNDAFYNDASYTYLKY